MFSIEPSKKKKMREGIINLSWHHCLWLLNHHNNWYIIQKFYYTLWCHYDKVNGRTKNPLIYLVTSFTKKKSGGKTHIHFCVDLFRSFYIIYDRKFPLISHPNWLPVNHNNGIVYVCITFCLSRSFENRKCVTSNS